MKRITPLVAILLVLAACSTKPSTNHRMITNGNDTIILGDSKERVESILGEPSMKNMYGDILAYCDDADETLAYMMVYDPDWEVLGGVRIGTTRKDAKKLGGKPTEEDDGAIIYCYDAEGMPAPGDDYKNIVILYLEDDKVAYCLVA